MKRKTYDLPMPLAVRQHQQYKLVTAGANAALNLAVNYASQSINIKPWTDAAVAAAGMLLAPKKLKAENKRESVVDTDDEFYMRLEYVNGKYIGKTIM